MEQQEMDPAAKLYKEALELVKPIESATAGGDSDVQQFYRGAVVFITGSTGFIGKQLLEKLFRTCEIRKAFILIRPKKGRCIKDRFQDMLSDPVFEHVLQKKPDIESRIVCVEGDVANLQLGLNENDWNTLVQEVDIIFHVAATVRFDENIRTAAITNVRGTREALALGRACKKLRSYVHVSTAYSYATIDRSGDKVLEQFHKSPVPAETLLNLVDTVDAKRLDTLTQSLISGWPNTYTFTKAIAEELVEAESGNLPVCIVRPSIVIGSYREPMPGWVDMSCVYGPTGLVLGGGIGVIRILYVKNTLKLSLVPVDYVNNATIAAGWQAGVRGLQAPVIYNITTSHVTFKKMTEYMLAEAHRLATPLCVWHYGVLQVKDRVSLWIGSWILHYIPAYIIDTAMTIFRIKKPSGLKSFVQVYKKYDKLCGVLSYFLSNEWHFEEANLQGLWQKMSDADRIIYNFDINSIDSKHHTMMWGLGVRKFILKDGLQGTKAAVAKQKWLKVANYTVAIIYLLVFWMILSWLWWIVRKCF